MSQRMKNAITMFIIAGVFFVISRSIFRFVFPFFFIFFLLSLIFVILGISILKGKKDDKDKKVR